MLFEAFYLSATGEKVLDERKGIWRLQFYNVLTQIVFLVLFSISSCDNNFSRLPIEGFLFLKMGVLIINYRYHTIQTLIDFVEN